MNDYYIIGIRLDNRLNNAAKLQEVLTNNGCSIKVRLGLHDVSPDYCSNDGLIIIRPSGEKEEVIALVGELDKIEGAKAKLIDLND